ncbi:MAG: S9 family peptidase [Phycisphaerales bacterium]
MATHTTPRGAKTRPVRPDDLARFTIVSDAQMSPDGERVLFSRKVAGPKNAWQTSLWMVPVDGGDPRAFTSGPRDGHGRWSADGARVAFIRAEPRHRPQIHVIDATGGESRALTRFPEGAIASFRWSPNGRFLAASFRANDPEWTEETKKRRESEGLGEPPRVLDHLWYRLDGDGYFNAQRHHLVVVDATTGGHRTLFDRDTLGSFSYDVSPDGATIAVTANTDRQALIKPANDRIFLVDVRSGRVRELAGPPAGPKTGICWSPDGRTLAWAGRADSKDDLYSTENCELWVTDARSGASRSLTARFDVCLMAGTLGDCGDAIFAPSIQWSPDGRRIFMRIGRQGQGHVASVAATAKGGRTTLAYHTRGRAEHQMGAPSADGRRMALVRIAPTAPSEACVLELGGAAGDRAGGAARVRPLTSFNRAICAGLTIVEPAPHWIDSTDGVRVHAWVLHPPGRAPARRRPAILMIHGGPHAQYGETFFHEMQTMASAGYAVVMINPRGSKGYGRDHCAAIRGAWGAKDWEDVQSALRWMKGRPEIDPRRIAIAGGSYGGYMVNWAIGHTHEFRCAITDRCVSNLLSMAGNSDYPDAPDRYWPGAVWDRWEARWECSPIKHFRKVKTPTLVIHSEGDLRCNIEQGEQVFAALTVLKVPTRFVRYPASTSHGMSRIGPPDMRMHRLGQMLEWFARWL